ncbi:pyrimidine/purine nucleoside phosphorylase [Diaphorobacter sp. HDW4B]|uniref:pyrimidine/purine nucleoside phosphorylase n=1 Tax=Diaphorobacter sp. HDW4B TaxID=2714925 RepID=UPI00140E5C4A|nr:pyrimidine/purine nucleoside phosphorylase [Diaphorobacter sp. HDW4B]QIL69285.1 pyrimidine/purine nucleoside phosphorylase [Diaphorobacter sp. HDW4B]
MTTEKIDSVSVTTKANVYFDGKCVSHNLTYPDGTKKSVGVVLASELTFGTAAAEIMECVGGSCEYKLAGSDQWLKSGPGEKFSIAANSKFDIRVAEAYHYICHYA